MSVSDEVPNSIQTPLDKNPTAFKGVTKGDLLKIMPKAGANVDRYLTPLNNAMNKFGINTASKQAAFLAQVAIESNYLKSVEENLNYSAKRLTQVWPMRFRTLASAEPYVNNPQALGNFVYASRMGNGKPESGDGYRYRGRGLIQVTGKDNYSLAGFDNNPDALTTPDIAASTAAEYFKRRGLNKKSEKILGRSEFDAISKIINGGSHKLDERWGVYELAVAVLSN